MFCRDKADVEAEEKRKQAAAERAAQNASKMCRSVLEQKVINDTAVAIMSLRLSSQEIIEYLTSLDDFSLNADKTEIIAKMFTDPEIEKTLEANRADAEDLTKEENYMLDLLRIPRLVDHLSCLDVKFNFTNRFLMLNKSL